MSAKDLSLEFAALAAQNLLIVANKDRHLLHKRIDELESALVAIKKESAHSNGTIWDIATTALANRGDSGV